MKVGVIGIVSEDLDKDFFGTVARLREIGYEGVEHSEGLLEKLKLSGKAFSKRMADMGMSYVAYHTLKYSFAEKGESLLDEAAEMGAEKLCIAWGPTESSSQISEDAELYNRMGLACRERGMELTYHNHDHEFAFAKDCSMRYLDMLLAATDPQLVRLHLDVAWCAYGGQDPLEYAKRYVRRISVFHMKDLKQLEPGCVEANASRDDAKFAEVNDGIMPIDELTEIAGQSSADWLVVEQDRLADLGPWESVARSYGNLAHSLEKSGALKTGV